MAPRVSVIIKSYNHAAFVAQSIRSVLDQSFQDFEIVVTDDASTDGSADIIRSFADPRISLVVFPRNRGIAAAMNATLARAHGAFIAILNSDDYALPGRLERQVAFLDAHPDTAGVFAMARAVDESGADTANYVDFRAAFALPDFSRRSWLRQFFFTGNVLCSPTAMVRRTAYQRAGEYDPRLTNLQDFDMWVRMCAHAPFHVLDEELTAFRVRSENRNMSAPRSDTLLRVQFEFAQILRRFRAMSPDLLREVFADDLEAHGLDDASPPDAWLAALALTVPSPAHRLFAAQTLFDRAQSDEDAHRLRDILGRTDIFGIDAARRLGDATAQYRRDLTAATRRTGEIEARAAELQHTLTSRDTEIGGIKLLLATQETEATELRRTLDRVLGSRSWRYTALPRRIMQRLRGKPQKN